VQQRTCVAELSTPFIKYVVWSSDMNHVALLSKHAIIIANKRLGQASTGASCHDTLLQSPCCTVPFSGPGLPCLALHCGGLNMRMRAVM
jgi:hypothetical protein